jgi:hypothetical protein
VGEEAVIGSYFDVVFPKFGKALLPKHRARSVLPANNHQGIAICIQSFEPLGRFELCVVS